MAGGATSYRRRPGGVTGTFIFEQGGVLGGIEVYGLEGDAPAVLPRPGVLELNSAASEGGVDGAEA